MKTTVKIAAFVFLLTGISESLDAQLYVPGGTSSIGTSSTSGVGIGTSGPRAALELYPLCSNGGVTPTFLISKPGNALCAVPYAYGHYMEVREYNFNNSAYTNPFILTGSGRIGINTPQTGPAFKMDMFTNGNNDGIRITQTGASAAYLGLNNNTGHMWSLYSTGSSNLQGGSNFLIYDQTSGHSRLFIKGSDGHVGINTDNLAAYSTTANLTVNGNMLIGDPSSTPLPGTYGLYVTGAGILATKIKVATVTGGSWSDFVFAKDYHLTTLDSVKNYVEVNHHLPNMPSASEVGTNGFDVAQMDALLLQQIEELWLHTIQLQEELNRTQAELAATKK